MSRIPIDSLVTITCSFQEPDNSDSSDEFVNLSELQQKTDKINQKKELCIYESEKIKESIHITRQTVSELKQSYNMTKDSFNTDTTFDMNIISMLGSSAIAYGKALTKLNKLEENYMSIMREISSLEQLQKELNTNSRSSTFRQQKIAESHTLALKKEFTQTIDSILSSITPTSSLHTHSET